MSVEAFLFIAAFILAAFHLLAEKGYRTAIGWAVFLVTFALVYSALPFLHIK